MVPLSDTSNPGIFAMTSAMLLSCFCRNPATEYISVSLLCCSRLLFTSTSFILMASWCI